MKRFLMRSGGFLRLFVLILALLLPIILTTPHIEAAIPANLETVPLTWQTQTTVFTYPGNNNVLGDPARSHDSGASPENGDPGKFRMDAWSEGNYVQWRFVYAAGTDMYNVDIVLPLTGIDPDLIFGSAGDLTTPAHVSLVSSAFPNAMDLSAENYSFSQSGDQIVLHFNHVSAGSSLEYYFTTNYTNPPTDPSVRAESTMAASLSADLAVPSKTAVSLQKVWEEMAEQDTVFVLSKSVPGEAEVEVERITLTPGNYNYSWDNLDKYADFPTNLVPITYSVKEILPSVNKRINFDANTNTYTFVNWYAKNGDHSIPCQLRWDAASIIHHASEDHANMNYVYKVKPGLFGSGDGRFEIQHWAGRTALYWRIPVATDYDIQNAKLYLNFTDSKWLPDPNVTMESLLAVNDQTSFVHVTIHDGSTSPYTIMDASDVTLTKESNTRWVIDIPYMPAKSALLFYFTGPISSGLLDSNAEYFFSSEFVADYNCVQVEKIWDGGTGPRPDVQFQLYQGTEAYLDPVTLTDGESSYLWSKLPIKDIDGNVYDYSVKEVTTNIENYQLLGSPVVSVIDLPESGQVKRYQFTNQYVSPTPTPTPTVTSTPTPTPTPTVTPIPTVVPTATATPVPTTALTPSPTPTTIPTTQPTPTPPATAPQSVEYLVTAENRIEGADAPQDGVFHFVFKAITPGAPMPNGYADVEMPLQVTGAKLFDVGKLRFTTPGTYVYEMRELDQVPAGFSFDPSLYTLTIYVTEVDGVLTQKAVITKNNGTAEEAGIVYVNKYSKPDGATTGSTATTSATPTTKKLLPRTGEKTSVLYGLSFALMLAALFLLVYRRYRAR